MEDFEKTEKKPAVTGSYFFPLAEGDPKPEAKPVLKPDTKPVPKPDPKPEVTPDPKPEVMPDPKPEAKPEVMPDPKPDPQMAAKLLNELRREEVPDFLVGEEKQAQNYPIFAMFRTKAGSLAWEQAKWVKIADVRQGDIALVSSISSDEIAALHKGIADFIVRADTVFAAVDLMKKEYIVEAENYRAKLIRKSGGGRQFSGSYMFLLTDLAGKDSLLAYGSLKKIHFGLAGGQWAEPQDTANDIMKAFNELKNKPAVTGYYFFPLSD